MSYQALVDDFESKGEITVQKTPTGAPFKKYLVYLNILPLMVLRFFTESTQFLSGTMTSAEVQLLKQVWNVTSCDIINTPVTSHECKIKKVIFIGLATKLELQDYHKINSLYKLNVLWFTKNKQDWDGEFKGLSDRKNAKIAPYFASVRQSIKRVTYWLEHKDDRYNRLQNRTLMTYLNSALGTGVNLGENTVVSINCGVSLPLSILPSHIVNIEEYTSDTYEKVILDHQYSYLTKSINQALGRVMRYDKVNDRDTRIVILHNITETQFSNLTTRIILPDSVVEVSKLWSHEKPNTNEDHPLWIMLQEVSSDIKS